MKDAIQKAIEGGWFPIKKGDLQKYYLFNDHGRYGFEANGRIELMSVADITNSPLFWQALGKAMGWGVMQIDGQDVRVGRDGYIHVWQCEWHRFIDHLAEGKHAEEFFTNLLK